MIIGKVIDTVQWFPGVEYPEVERTDHGHFFREKQLVPGDFILTLADHRKVVFRVNHGVVPA